MAKRASITRLAMGLALGVASAFLMEGGPAAAQTAQHPDDGRANELDPRGAFHADANGT